jgi:hypothetical protein
MTGAHRSAAEETAAFLVQAGRSGSPVLIPGAFEKRAAGPTVRPRARADVVVIGYAPPIVASDLDHLEHQREGGGAPSARAGRRSGTIGGRLWHSLLHPADLPDIWRRVLPQGL